MKTSPVKVNVTPNYIVIMSDLRIINHGCRRVTDGVGRDANQRLET
jgi:hypothetical protein